MLNVFDVANYFIAKSNLDEDCVTHLKLQKLVYYAQGFHLALFHTPLFSESIEAWEHGPVVPTLYAKYSAKGNQPITETDHNFDITIFEEKIIELLDDVYDVYGQFSAWKLRNLTHHEQPWMETPKNLVIANEVMEKYFQTLLVK